MEKRNIAEQDLGILEESLNNDQFHKDTTVDFFLDPRTECEVYSDKGQPVAFVRCAKSLRLDIQFCSNSDKLANAKLLMENLEVFCKRAADSGFVEVVFCSDSPELVAFCTAKCGFVAVNGEMRKLL